MTNINGSMIKDRVGETITKFRDTFLNHTYPFDKEVNIQCFFYRSLLSDENGGNQLILSSPSKYYVELVKPEFKLHKDYPGHGFYDLVVLNPDYVSYVLDREIGNIGDRNQSIGKQFCYADVLGNNYYNSYNKKYLQSSIEMRNMEYCFEFKYLAFGKADDMIYGDKNSVKFDINRLRRSFDYGVKNSVCVFVTNSLEGEEVVNRFKDELSEQHNPNETENKVRVIILEHYYASSENGELKLGTEYYI